MSFCNSEGRKRRNRELAGLHSSASGKKISRTKGGQAERRQWRREEQPPAVPSTGRQLGFSSQLLGTGAGPGFDLDFSVQGIVKPLSPRGC